MTFDPSQQQPPAAPQPAPAPQASPTSPFAPPPAGAVPPTGGYVPPAAGQMPPQGQPMVPTFIPPTVAASVANPKPKGRTSVGTLAFVIAVVVAAAGLGFAGGRLTAPASSGRGTGNFGGNFPGGNFPGGSFAPGASGGANRGGFGGFGGGNISVTGQVTAVANGSITIQTANGQSVTLQVPSTVTYHAQASAAPSDVSVGSQVQVSAGRGNFRPEASGQPGVSGGTGGQGGAGLTVTDITVLGK